jgi:hypothetical protein
MTTPATGDPTSTKCDLPAKAEPPNSTAPPAGNGRRSPDQDQSPPRRPPEHSVPAQAEHPIFTCVVPAVRRDEESADRQTVRCYRSRYFPAAVADLLAVSAARMRLSAPAPIQHQNSTPSSETATSPYDRLASAQTTANRLNSPSGAAAARRSIESVAHASLIAPDSERRLHARSEATYHYGQ